MAGETALCDHPGQEGLMLAHHTGNAHGIICRKTCLLFLCGKKGKLKVCLLLSSSSSSVRLKVSCEGWRDGWLSCSQTVPVPVLERDIVARLRRYADVEVPTVLMEVLPW